MGSELEANERTSLMSEYTDEQEEVSIILIVQNCCIDLAGVV